MRKALRTHPDRGPVESECVRRTAVREPEEPHGAAVAGEARRRHPALGRVARVEALHHLEPDVVSRRHGMRLVREEAEHVAERVVGWTPVHGPLLSVAPHKPEALEHRAVVVVHEREVPGGNCPRRVAHGAAHSPLRLRVFRPLNVRHRVRVFKLGRASRALHDVERAAVALHELAQGQHVLCVRDVWVGIVWVVDEIRGEVERVLLLEPFKDARVVVGQADRRAVDLRVRLNGADRPRGAVEKLRIVRALPEWLVPHLPLVHDVLVAADARLHVPDPRRERLWVARHLAHHHAEAEVASVDRVAVGEADPRLHAEGRHFAHGPVEPREVVDALLLLRLRPAGEEPPVLRAERTEVGLHRVPVRVVAVERLAADGPCGRFQVLRLAHGEASDLLQSGIELVQPLPRHALARRRGSLRPLLRALRNRGRNDCRKKYRNRQRLISHCHGPPLKKSNVTLL